MSRSGYLFKQETWIKQAYHEIQETRNVLNVQAVRNYLFLTSTFWVSLRYLLNTCWTVIDPLKIITEGFVLLRDFSVFFRHSNAIRVWLPYGRLRSESKTSRSQKFVRSIA